MPQAKYKYDVFLSYSTADTAVVHLLAKQLRDDGVRVWLDAWAIAPTESIPVKIEEGLELSRVLVVCSSVNGLGSKWMKREVGNFEMRDPANEKGRYLAVRLDATEIKGSLAQFRYIDLRTHVYEKGYTELVAMVRRKKRRPLSDEPDEPERPRREDVSADLEKLACFIDRELEIIKVNDFLKTAVKRERPSVVVVCGDVRQEHGRFCDSFRGSKLETLRHGSSYQANKHIQVNLTMYDTEEDTYAVLKENLFSQVPVGRYREKTMVNFVEALAQRLVVIEFSLTTRYLRRDQLPRVFSRLVREMETCLKALDRRRAAVVLWVNYIHPLAQTPNDVSWQTAADILRESIQQGLDAASTEDTFGVVLRNVDRGNALQWVLRLRTDEDIRPPGQAPCALVRLLLTIDHLTPHIRKRVAHDDGMPMEELVEVVKAAGQDAMTDWKVKMD